ncbi:MFS transporter [uncultured Parolsenella sp.]|uniref:MFS transporter n=1 Tax=uncultured Parolsenella sp. TaxID=2083008 RepID=UPI0025DAA9AC|nr:MFS transporter [uncultured Parolsenella sp.]
MAQSGKKEANMVTLFFANVLYWVCAGVYSPFLSAHYTGLGLSAAETGILLAATPVCALIIQPLWSMIADKLGCRRAVIVVLCLGAAILAPLYYLAKTFVPVLLVTFAFSAFFSGLLPLSDSLVIELADRSGLDFARIRMGGTIGYAIVVLIVGRLLDVAPQIQFAVVSAALVIFAAHMWRLPEVGVRTNAEDAPKAGHGKGLLSLFTSNEIVFVLVFAFISSAAIGFIGAFLGRYAVELGEGQNLVGVMSAVSAASEIPILLVSSRLVKRFGEMNLLIFSCFMAALRLVLVGTGIVPVMICGQLLQSVSYMTVYYSCVTYIANHTYEDCRARGQSAFAMVQSGLSVVVANLFGGWACDAFGTRTGFLIFALASTIAAVVALVAYAAWRRNAAPRPET